VQLPPGPSSGAPLQLPAAAPTGNVKGAQTSMQSGKDVFVHDPYAHAARPGRVAVAPATQPSPQLENEGMVPLGGQSAAATMDPPSMLSPVAGQGAGMITGMGVNDWSLQVTVREPLPSTYNGATPSVQLSEQPPRRTWEPL